MIIIKISTHDIESYFRFILERINTGRDIHFYTNTTIDTLDYSGTSLNSGSKVLIAAYGDIKRKLATEVPGSFKEMQSFQNPQLIIPGIVALQASTFISYDDAQKEIELLNAQLKDKSCVDSNGGEVVMIILTEDASFAAANLNNFLWVTFTRCNPSHDIHGVESSVIHKHWGCSGPLIFDARKKPHHAPVLQVDNEVEKNIERLFNKGGSLYGILK